MQQSIRLQLQQVFCIPLLCLPKWSIQQSHISQVERLRTKRNAVIVIAGNHCNRSICCRRMTAIKGGFYRDSRRTRSQGL